MILIKRISSKNCILNIFEYFEKSIALNLIKYNRFLKKKLNISEYDFLQILIEKKYLHIYQEPSLYKYLNNIGIIKVLEPEKINDLINTITEGLKNNYDFDIEKEKKNNNTLTINKEIDFTSNILDNIMHLTISYLENIKIPLSTIKNLDSLFLIKISIITITNDLINIREKPIVLDKIKNLKLSNINISDEKIKLEFPNLKYLELDKLHHYSFLKNILGFNFAYKFFKINIHNNNRNNGDKKYKNSLQKIIFEDETFPKNLEVFTMSYENIRISKFINTNWRYGYLVNTYEKTIKMEKLKNNKIKYTFSVKENEVNNDKLSELKEERISNNKYENYISKKKVLYLSGKYIYNNKYSNDKETMQFDINKINELNVSKLCNFENNIIISGKNYIKLFKYINSDNFCFNYIKFNYIDITLYSKFIEKIKLLKNLIRFTANICVITKELLFKLFESFFSLKMIRYISILVKDITLDNEEQKQIENKCPLLIKFKPQGKNILIRCDSEEIVEVEKSGNFKIEKVKDYELNDSDFELSEDNNKNKFELEEKSSEDLGESLEKIEDSEKSESDKNLYESDEFDDDI